MRSSLLLRICVATAGAVFLLSGASLAVSLDTSLAQVEKQYKNGADLRAVESLCLGLLKEHPAKEEQGKIYAEIPILYMTQYGKDSASQRKALSKGDIIGHCKKALSYPLDTETAAKVFLAWGTAEMQAMPARDAKEYADARKGAVEPFLLGVQFLAEQGVPDEAPAFTRPVTLRAPGTEEYIQEWKASAKAQVKLADLVMWKQLMAKAAVGLYAGFPTGVDDLQVVASVVVKDNASREKMISYLKPKDK